jgi:hypothetical protein
MNQILAILCAVAVLPLPYGFYLLLRPAVCLGMVYLLVRDWNKLGAEKRAICVVLAVLFNPFMAIYVSKLIWIPVDAFSAWWLWRRYR